MPCFPLHDLAAIASNAFRVRFAGPWLCFDLQAVTVWEEKGEVLLDSRNCVVSLYLVSVETEDLLTPQPMVHELIGIFN